MKLRNVIGSLREKAKEARTKAYAPYSGFQVGACALGVNADGEHVYALGANIEAACSSVGVCAERVAISALLMQGVKPSIVCIDAESDKVTPCGVCLQFMNEWRPTIVTPSGFANFASLLPRPYQGRRPKL